MSVRVVDPGDTLAVLKAAEEWLSDQTHWTTGAYGRDEDGRMTVDPMRAKSTCVNGALCLVMGVQELGDAPRRVRMPLERALVDLGYAEHPEDHPALDVNDGRQGYERVMSGLRKAIESLEYRGQG